MQLGQFATKEFSLMVSGDHHNVDHAVTNEPGVVERLFAIELHRQQFAANLQLAQFVPQRVAACAIGLREWRTGCCPRGELVGAAVQCEDFLSTLRIESGQRWDEKELTVFDG